MDIKKLQFIKKTQREYLELFGEKLHIEWDVMLDRQKNYAPTGDFDEEAIMNKINELCNKYNVKIDDITSNVKRVRTSREINFFIDYFKWSRVNRYSTGKVCKLVNKDRTMYYYYDKKGKQITTRKEQEES